MKRKLFTKVLLTLTMLFGLSGVANAQVDPKVEAQVKEQSAKELKLIKDYLKLEDTGLEKLEEILEGILIDKNTFLVGRDINEGRTRWTLKYNYWTTVERLFNAFKLKEEFESLNNNESLLESMNFKFYINAENEK